MAFFSSGAGVPGSRKYGSTLSGSGAGAGASAAAWPGRHADPAVAAAADVKNDRRLIVSPSSPLVPLSFLELTRTSAVAQSGAAAVPNGAGASRKRPAHPRRRRTRAWNALGKRRQACRVQRRRSRLLLRAWRAREPPRARCGSPGRAHASWRRTPGWCPSPRAAARPRRNPRGSPRRGLGDARHSPPRTRPSGRNPSFPAGVGNRTLIAPAASTSTTVIQASRWTGSRA